MDVVSENSAALDIGHDVGVGHKNQSLTEREVVDLRTLCFDVYTKAPHVRYMDYL
jgi:hypothetical protein